MPHPSMPIMRSKLVLITRDGYVVPGALRAVRLRSAMISGSGATMQAWDIFWLLSVAAMMLWCGLIFPPALPKSQGRTTRGRPQLT